MKRSEPSSNQDTSCLVQVVTAAMREEPALEAVRIDRASDAFSIALMGKAQAAEMEQQLAARVRGLQAEPGGPRCGLLTGKGDCASCPTPLSPEQSRNVQIQRAQATTTISRVTCPTAPSFWRWHNISWPKVVQRDVEFLESAEHPEEWKAQLLAAAACGLFGSLAWFLGVTAWSLPLFVAAYVAGAWFTVEEVWERLREGAIDVHFLMLAVAIGSASIGAWGEGATLLFLFSFSGALEHYALGRTQREIQSLFKHAPKMATLVDDTGHEREIPVEQLRPEMRVIVKPGVQFPVDVEIVKGHTAADESNLTGEAAPVEKKVGDTALSGTINLWGAVEAVVLRAAGQSALQKIIRLIQDAQHLKAPSQRFTDKFSATYTYLVLALSFVMFFAWWLGFGRPAFTSTAEQASAFYRTMTLLVVASPCALVLSIPSAVLAAIAWGARRGVLFRGGAAVEKLAEVTVVAMDKTGTLTTGELKVERVESFPSGREPDVAQLAYSLERLSNHPLARAVTRHGKHQGLAVLPLVDFESVTGMGLQARWQGKVVKLGRREWLVNETNQAVIARVTALDAGFAEVWVASEGLLGRVVLRDDIRPQSAGVVAQLRTRGLSTIVLTGDRQAAAEHLKAELHLDDVRAELKPEEKVAAIQTLAAEGHKVAMIGDGVNDAPSLAAAHVGVAMGARGSDAALEQAEVVLMHDRLENFLAAHELSQRARRIIQQNLVVSLGTVLVLVTFALLGGIPLTLGVVGHEGSTVVVVMNSLRLLFGKTSS
jgi:Cd2+/Zn2+-exporting ATPase